ncbi:MAG TPA: hypothetical protein VFX98_19405 [Longimicrobiaceae bacterium]|nr:hypothetical protein [Longimicrobiaceae bacterium]
MIRQTLDLNELAVETFAILPAGSQYSGLMAPPPSDDTYDVCCDEAYLRAPITMHTDPCDLCCNTETQG